MTVTLIHAIKAYAMMGLILSHAIVIRGGLARLVAKVIDYSINQSSTKLLILI